MPAGVTRPAGDQRNLVAGPRAERARELRSDTMPNLRGRATRASRHHNAGRYRRLLLELRHDAPNHRPADAGAEQEHPLSVHERAGRRHCGCAAASRATTCQSASRLSAPVICTCETTPRCRGAKLPSGPVHHREHHDPARRRRARCRASSGEMKGDEVIAALGARVAQPDEEVRIARCEVCHTGDKLESGCTSICIFPISSPPREFPPQRVSPPRDRYRGEDAAGGSHPFRRSLAVRRFGVERQRDWPVAP